MKIIEVCRKSITNHPYNNVLFDTQNITIDALQDDYLQEKNIRLSVLRLDKIHPVVSGNKLFKLHYFLEEALAQNLELLTYGGAYSNHLVATAYACKQLNISCKAVVRGEQPARLSHTLTTCIELGMQLQFVSREDYAAMASKEFQETGLMNVPEGGYHPTGAKGAALILKCKPTKDFTHICTATGTATTLAGLLLQAQPSQQILSYAALKGLHDIPERLQFLTGQERFNNLQLVGDYHFGGYAKKTAELLDFMNELYLKHNLPTDFVYTAKMMFGIFDQVHKGFFAEGSNILCIHTGGLQGNLSLPAGSLHF